MNCHIVNFFSLPEFLLPHSPSKLDAIALRLIESALPYSFCFLFFLFILDGGQNLRVLSDTLGLSFL